MAIKTVNNHIRDHLLTSLGVTKMEPLESLLKSAWSPTFEHLMRNRLVMGALRYGKIGASGKPAYNRTEAIRSFLDDYNETGNLECLVDIANLAMVEFEEGRHPGRHFHSTDDINHVRALKD